MLTMMLCSGLTPEEQAKVERLDKPLSELFAAAGKTVRLCAAYTDNQRRMIGFIDTPTKSRVATLPASELAALSDEALLVRLNKQLP